MDPDACVKRLVTAVAAALAVLDDDTLGDKDRDTLTFYLGEVEEASGDLAEWLNRQGFMPTPGLPPSD